jgi:hypothetical protein
MKIVFIHQNFPGQFKHLAPALAAGGDEVVALGINKPAYATAGVRVILHRPQTAGAEALREAPIEIQETLAKTARGHSVARCLIRLKEEGFVPDVICAHSGWGKLTSSRTSFPQRP